MKKINKISNALGILYYWFNISRENGEILAFFEGLPLYFKGILFRKDRRFREFNEFLAEKIAEKVYGIKLLSYEFGFGSEVFGERIYTRFADFVPSSKDIVIDVGAQIGDYSILCAKIYKARVYAFEPLPSNFKLLRGNIKINNVKNIKIYRIALSDKEGEEISYYKDNMLNNERVGTPIKIQFKTLDSFRLNPSIIKIDVEGYEMHVLKGAIETLKKYHPKIIIETHSIKLEKEVTRFLENLGYKIKHIGKVSYSDQKGFDKVSNLFFEYSK